MNHQVSIRPPSSFKAARQLEYFKGRDEAGPTSDSLADALAIVQHHDVASGTEQQYVANDYAKRLSIGYKELNWMKLGYKQKDESPIADLLAFRKVVHVLLVMSSIF